MVPIFITNKELLSCTYVKNKFPKFFFVRKQNVNKPCKLLFGMQSVKKVKADLVTASIERFKQLLYQAVN